MLAYELDRWHRYSWRRFTEEESEAIPALLRDADGRKASAWGLLGAEVFARLLSGDELDELDEPQEWAKQVHAAAAELAEWHELVELCRLDRYAAGCSAVAITTALEEAAEKMGLEPPPMGAGGGEGDGEGEGQQGQGPGALGTGFQPKQNGQGQQKPGQSGQPKPSKSMGEGEALDSAMRQAIRKAAKQSAQEVEDGREAEAAFGRMAGSDPAALGKAPDPKRVKRLASMLGQAEAFKRIARMAGRARGTIQRKRASMSESAPAELADVTLGGNVNRIVPTELAMLRRRASRLDVLRRLLNQSALCYEVKGKEPCERGPIVVAFDMSGSMQGTPEEWAKAIAAATASVAAESKRKVACIAYNVGVQWSGVFPDKGLDGVEQLLGLSAGGGTDWEAPLKAAMDLIGSPEKAWDKADIIFVTDGYCSLDSTFAAHFAKWRAEQNVTALGVVITSPGENAQFISQALAGFTDRRWTIEAKDGVDSATSVALLEVVAEVI